MVSHEPFYAPERVLIVVAHADDIEFGVSGTVARWTAAGTEVTYLIVTNNASGSNDPKTNLIQLKATRMAEQIASAAEVGVTDVRFFEDKYQDGILEPTLELRKDITRVIRDVRPNLVVTFDPEVIIVKGRDYINHPDHRAVALATLYATFPSAGARPIFPDLLDEGLEPHDVNKMYLMMPHEATLYVNISDTVERKANALRCHQSQFDERVVEMVLGWNADAAAAFAVDYVESFRVLNLKDDQPDQSVIEATDSTEAPHINGKSPSD